MINVQHVRFSALTAVLLLSTVTLITIDEGQSSVFAQNVTSTLLPPRLPSQDSTSTPTASAQDSTSTPTTSAQDSTSTSAQDSTSTPTTSPIEPAGSDDESSGISGSNDNGDNGDSQDTSDDDGSDSRDTSSNDEEEETEDNFEQTDPLRNQIRNAVIGVLSASGIAVP